MKLDQAHPVAANHPTVGNISVGDYVLFNNSSIGRVSGAQDHTLYVQWLYRPHELLARIPPEVTPPGRSLDSFASNELVLGTTMEPASLSDVMDKVVVLTIDQVVNPAHKPAGGQWFFYRQVVEVTTWHLEPALVPRVLLPEGSMIVENPEMVYSFCDCKGDAVLHPTGRLRTAVGDIETGYEKFTCPSCESMKQKNSGEADPPNGGKQWLDESTHAKEPKDDAKRVAVIEKFVHALQLAVNENSSETLVIGNNDVVRKFCVDMEHQIHNLYIEKPRDYKARVFTLTFNLSDSKNTSLRRRIVQGHFSPAELAVATADQLASEHLQEKRKEQRDKYFSTHVVQRAEEAISTPAQQALQKKARTETPKPIESVYIPMVEIPDFEPPPAAHTPEPAQPAVCMDVSPQRFESLTPEEARLPEATIPSSDAHSKLLEFANRLKRSLSNIENTCLQAQAMDFVDYYLRHSRDVSNHT